MKFSKKIKKNVAAEPESRKWVWLQLGAGVVMTVAVAALYIFDARENQSASNSNSKHDGHYGAFSQSGGAHAVMTSGAPVGVNAAPAPGPAPEGMVWVPGGTFWMG